MEYHAGIVILTTNRLTTLDAAVQSRVHLAIQYPELETQHWINIFQTSLQKSGADCSEADNKEIEEYLKSTVLSEQHDEVMAWNGREVRNLVTGAVASMKFAGETFLKRRHFEGSYKAINQLKRQLQRLMYDWKRESQARNVKRGAWE